MATEELVTGRSTGDAFESTLSEDQRDLRDRCRRFVDDVVLPFGEANREREWHAPPEQRWPRELLEGVEDLGLRSIGMPAGSGGVELDAVSLALVVEELSRGDPGFSNSLTQNWKCLALLAGIAPEHLRARWFAAYRDDAHFLIAHAMTESTGASDRWLPYNVPEAAMETSAEESDGGWRLRGRKRYISNGSVARLYIVYARTTDGVGMLDGTSSFLVPADTPGITTNAYNEKIGQNYVINADVSLDCWLPADHLLVRDRALGGAGGYFKVGKVLNAARALGVARRAFERSVAFARTHVQGGKPIIKHQLVAGRLADMATRVQTMRTATYAAARALDDRAADAAAVGLMTKLYTAETAFEVCRQAVEVFGGRGSMREDGVEKHLRDAAIFLHTDGTTDMHRLKIIKALYPDDAGTYAGPDVDGATGTGHGRSDR